MNTTAKASLSIAAIFLGLLASVALLLSPLFLHNLEQIETTQTEEHVERLRSYLETIEGELTSTARDWAYRDHTHAYALGQRPIFLQENLLDPETYKDLDIQVMILIDVDNQVIHPGGYDFESEELAPLSPALMAYLEPSSPLLRPSKTQMISGLVDTDEGLMCVVAAAILHSDRSGPIAGTIVIGRRVTEEALSSLLAGTHVEAEIFRLAQPDLPQDVEEGIAGLTPDGEERVVTADDVAIRGYTVLADVNGQARFALRLETPRSIYQQGRSVRTYIFAILVALGLIFGSALLWVVMRLFHTRQEQRRLERLYQSFVRQTQEGVVLVEANGGEVLYINEAAARLLDIPIEQVKSRRFGDIFREGERCLRSVFGSSSSNSNSEVRSDVEFVRLDGRKLVLELSASRISQDDWVTVIVMIRDITQQRKAEQRIRHYAYYDHLTGLPSRLLFQNRMENALARARRTDASIAILFVDLDEFKLVNDIHGHDTGDKLLKLVGQRIKNSVREGDSVARTGGDEFLVLLAEIEHLREAIEVCDRLLDLLRRPFAVNGQQLRVTGSIGITLFPDDGDDFRTLMRSADMAMYCAKEEGRDCWRLFDASMNDRLINLVEMRKGLSEAIETNSLVLHYQPIVGAESGELVGLEALVRWPQDDGSLMQPNRFIPIAEDTGIIEILGEWVVRESCRQLRRWQDAGLDPRPVAVNVSARQFADPNLVARIARALNDFNVDPKLLAVEITESIAADAQRADEVLRNLKELGITISLDDFGTGYSSLSVLRRFPIDRVKIDRTFIKDIINSTDCDTLVTCVIDLIHGFGLQAVAEGVESSLQIDVLREKRCDHLQGYALCPPVSADTLLPLLKSSKMVVKGWLVGPTSKWQDRDRTGKIATTR